MIYLLYFDVGRCLGLVSLCVVYMEFVEDRWSHVENSMVGVGRCRPQLKRSLKSVDRKVVKCHRVFSVEKGTDGSVRLKSRKNSISRYK